MVSRFVQVLRWGVLGLALGLRHGLTSSGSEGEEAAAPAADAPPEPDAPPAAPTEPVGVVGRLPLRARYKALRREHRKAMELLTHACVPTHGPTPWGPRDELSIGERIDWLADACARSKAEVAARVKEVRQLDEALGIRQANEGQLAADLELLRTAVQVSHADNASLRARLGVAEARAQQLATAPHVAGARCVCGVVLLDGRTLCGRCDPSQRLGPVLDPTAETVPVPAPLAPGEG